MKKLVQGLFIITVLAIFFTGCGQAPRQDQDRTRADAEMFDPTTIRDDVVELIRQAPSTNDVFNFLNKTGAAYIFDMTVPFAAVQQHESTSQLSLLLGAYLSDAMYASAYNRMDQMRQTIDVASGLAVRLGLQNELEHTMAYLEKIRETDDQEAREALIEEMLDQGRKEFVDSDMADIYALVFIGANVEALYLLSYLTLFARDNQAMLDFMLERTDMAQTIYDLLRLLTDEVYLELNPRIRGYYNSSREIANFFKDVDTFTLAELEVVNRKIETLRNDMFDIKY